MKAFITYQTYGLADDKTQIELYGKLENGQSFAILQTLEPYFFIQEEHLKQLEKYLTKYKVKKTSLKTFNNEKVVKISSNNHIELHKISHFIHTKNIPTYESDIKPHTRFMIDHNIFTSIDIKSTDYETAEKIDRVYKNPDIKPINFTPKLKVVSIDTETDTKGNLYCIGIYSDNYEKNFMITDKKLKNVISCKDELDCILKFKQAFFKLDPDIVTGWNFIDFDLQYLQTLFRKYKVQFDLGRTNENARLRLSDNFLKASTADFPGRQVIDGLNFIKDPFIQEAPSIRLAEYDSYTLEDVSQAILKKGKLLKGKHRGEEIESLYKTNTEKSLQHLADYNLLDCQLAYEILEKTKMIELAIERAELTGLPLDKITASVAAFDSVYIRAARARNLVSPTTKYAEREERIKGGYVSSLQSGIFKNVLIFDFKSLYPSIIRTFNIDPASYIEKSTKDSIASPNGAHFTNTEGILPMMIQRLHEAREKAKKEKRELSSYAIKVIMNSSFGVLANPNCRYYNLNIANAITHFGQQIIKETAKQIEKMGFKVLYSDTDSVFIETNLTKEKANAKAKEISKHINDFYDNYVKTNFNRKSFLELQFAKQYLTLLIPRIRGQEEDIAAKKRYAGLVEEDGKEKIEVTGLEAIRGDWTDAAREFQLELLEKVFHDKPIESFIKEFIKKLKDGKLDEKLVYTKSIRKGLEEYTKTTPPHVKAARKLEKLDSNIIKYYITTDGPEPIQKLTHKLDYDHYIDKQIKPIANQILQLLDKDFDDSQKNSKQAKLF